MLILWITSLLSGGVRAGDLPLPNPLPDPLPDPHAGPARRGALARPIDASLPRKCAEIEADAAGLLWQAEVCDQPCELVALEPLLEAQLGGRSCLAAVQCAVALPAQADHRFLVDRLAILADEKATCGDCATALCMPMDALAAVCEQGRCVVKVR